MGDTTLRRFLLFRALLIMALAGCGEGAEGDFDCRHSAAACAAGFICAEQSPGAWRCTPEADAGGRNRAGEWGDGGAPGDASRGSDEDAAHAGDSGGPATDAARRDAARPEAGRNDAGARDAGGPEPDASGGGCRQGAERACGSDVGACRAGRQSCGANGRWGPCVGATEPNAEQCDGADDDCDGEVDEGDPGGGGFCDTGEPGACRAGAQRCEDGTLVCVRNVEPAADDDGCDGVDDDCDGVPDEDWRTDAECGVGACARPERCVQGQVVCRPGEPTEEVCNGRDDDCDGQTDEDARPEECNRRDDDCDGHIDEGDPGGGVRCDTGEYGRCAIGTRHCIEGALACIWNVAPGPRDATCNGSDDDCDGQTDEDWSGGSCGRGVCRRPERCDAGAVVCTPGEPLAETCNGQDDDCDGAVDEGLRPTPTECGVGACRSVGERVCAEGALRDTCRPAEPSPEVCDGEVDDNCNGHVDDGCQCVNGARRPCGTDVGSCREGDQACVGGRWTACEGAVEPTEEVCNGADDDCNGIVDDVPLLQREPRILPDIDQRDYRAMEPSIAWSGQEFGLIWRDFGRRIGVDITTGVYSTRIGIDGAPLDAGVPLGPQRRGASALNLIWNGNSFAASWIGGRDDGERRLYLGIFRPGQEASARIIDVAPANGQSLRTSLAWTGDSYGITWDNDTSGSMRVYFTRVDGDGHVLVQPQAVDAGNARSTVPAIAWSGNTFGIVWSESDGHGAHRIWFTALDPDGQHLMEPAQLPHPEDSSLASITWGGDSFGIVGNGAPPWFIRGTRDGLPLEPLVPLVAHPAVSNSVAIAWAQDHFAVAWIEIVGDGAAARLSRVRADAGSVTQPVEISASVSTRYGDLSIAFGDPFLGLAWVQGQPTRLVTAVGLLGCRPADW